MINKFIRDLAIFMLPIFLLGISTESALRNIPNDYSYKRRYLDENSASIEALFLGSSHAFRSINPNFINLNGFNAAYVSQTLNYDYKIIKKYDGHWDHLKYIVMAISYPSLFFQLKTSTESWRVKNYNIYYGMFSSGNLSDYFEILSNNPQINLKRMKSYYLLGKTNLTSSALGWGSLSSKKQNDLVKTGAAAAKRHTAADDAYFNENMDILRSIIHIADKEQIKIILYTPPAFHTYVEHLDKTQLNRTITAMTQLDKDHQNVIYVNFLTDNSFIESDFYNADHLNELGAAKLTKKIGNIIEMDAQRSSVFK
jgi:hypothetical protein